MLVRALLAVTTVLAASVLVATSVEAQADALQPTLELGAAHLAGESSDGIYPGYQGQVEVPWMLTFGEPATAARELTGETHAITWTLDCPAPLRLPATSTVVEHVPAQTTYEGKAVLTVFADEAAPGISAIPCIVTGTFTGTSTQVQATTEASLFVMYAGTINATTIAPERNGGPQKRITYPIDVTNNGNARTLLTFEVSKPPASGWQVLLPEPVVLERGDTQTVHVVVSTPHDNGYNEGSTDLTIIIHPSSFDAPEQVGPTVSIDLEANVKGFYVPGPGFGLLALTLGLVAIVRARRS